ncbi:metallophosphoesterase [Marinobacter alexandrii]|uniref:metallophosphoesterase n=1 Tax=Marinobacter alexandrii TaxID=2570351 RepID=UPI001108B97E|nr:metallophosphoesterase [Marinobacter alexandrii]
MELQKFDRNELGRDFVVGDIHGCYSLLMRRLNKIGFDKTKDRLFSVGDLVDRGPESFLCLSLPYEPWFFAVRGNHELLMHDALNGGDAGLWMMNGGNWCVEHELNDLRILVNDMMERLPLAIEVQAEAGSVGIIHADVTSDQWGRFDEQRDVWSRDRISRATRDWRPVKGIDAVVVGHTILEQPNRRDNVLHIDTGAFHTGWLYVMPISEVFA